jgi:hypothetical protein
LPSWGGGVKFSADDLFHSPLDQAQIDFENEGGETYNRDVLHKIGVTSGDVKQRVANARLDPTYLMADVEIVATYELYNINRSKLENLIHRIFNAAQLNIEIKDRFGNPVVPREWFLVPRFVIDEAVDRIRDGTITDYTYDPKTAALLRTGGI